ncbi:MAG: radical SAM family heme chaperone HemW [Amoebophilaceae bacterium]|nr:radical SAM family heme chaperone HemW [Amoebophilaceae bacterium]
MNQTGGGIYLHIPFCKQACHYCNFHFSTNLKLKSLMVESMQKELMLHQSYFNARSITSIYFGGGTPSLLTVAETTHLLNTIFKYFAVEPGVEITLEANPDDLTLDKLKEWLHIGINRLSIGIQSFNDATLRYMHRAHTSAMAQRSVEWARKAGFDNVGIDLIYGIPDATIVDCQTDLEKLLALAPDHISTYCLTIENKTVFGHWYKEGKIREPAEELVAAQFLLIIEACKKQNYLHYEISNFCKPGKYSRHNANYWKKGPYLGIGPSAHSYNGLERQWNIANNSLYIKSIRAEKLPYSSERLTIANQINEYIMTSIRTCWGCDFSWIYNQYTIDLMELQRTYITNIILKKLAYLVENKLYLTNNGKLLADSIARDLFVDRSTGEGLLAVALPT